MDIDTLLHQILTASPAPTTLGLALFPDLAPPSQSGRYSVYQLVSSPQLLTQDGNDPEGTRIWVYEFRQYGPSPASVAFDTISIRDFLVGVGKFAGIQRVLEVNTISLPTSSPGRIYCRMLELHITENLS